jgi:hypothetical protein
LKVEGLNRYAENLKRPTPKSVGGIGILPMESAGTRCHGRS